MSSCPGQFTNRYESLAKRTTWVYSKIIAYSKQGYSNKEWVMPQGWEEVKSVDLYEISIDGPEPVKSGRKILNGRLELSLVKDEAVSIVPHGFDNQAH